MNKDIAPADIANITERLNRLSPTSQRQWGTLTSGELLMHLSDALTHPLGDRPAPLPPRSWFRHVLLKWLVLWVFPRMPQGAKTRAGADPKKEGSKPTDFARDLASLHALNARFVAAAQAGAITTEHTRFGPMENRDWLRWWWMHNDHHLRQFGVR